MFPAIFFAAVDKRRGKVIFYLRRKIDPVKGGNMPLPIAPVGETLTVTKILADERNKRHLEDLGIAPGCTLQLLSVSGGSVILRIREGRLAIDRSYMTHIVNGRKKPSPEMAKRIGLLLGFDWRIFYADGKEAL